MLPLVVGLVPTLLARLAPGPSRGLSLVGAAALLTLLALDLAGRLLPSLGGDVALVAAAVVAGAALAALVRWPLPGRLLSLALPLPVVLVALFLTDPAVQALRTGDRQALVAAAPAAAPVVVLVFDELPSASLVGDDGRLDRLLFPQLARLADRSTWYRQATTTHEDGRLAELALLTGRRQPELDDPDLFDLLAPSHRLVLFERDTRRAPPPADAQAPPGLAADLLRLTARAVLPEPFRSRVPEALGRPQARPVVSAGEEIDDRVLRLGAFAGALRDGPQPALSWLSSDLPGAPWTLLPDGLPAKADDPRTGLDDGVWSDAPALVERAHQRHLLQLGAWDRLLGQVLDQLEREQLFERALVLVTARRGAAFRPGQPHLGAELGTAAEVAPVPLLIKAPGQTEGVLDDRPAELVDVLPTLAALLDLPVPDDLDGLSLVSDPPPARPDQRVSRTGRAPLRLVDGAFDPAAAAARRSARYGPAPSWPDVLAQGTGRRLRGRDLAELGVAGVLDAEGVLAGVRAANGRGPLHLAGFVRLFGAATPPAVLAITLDDRVVATTPTEPRGADRLAFSLLLPEDVLGDGRRSLGLYAAGPDEDDGLSLVPQVSYALTRDDRGRPRLEATDGREVLLEDDGWYAVLDGATRDGQGLTLTGWAGDPPDRRPADAVLVFRDGRLVAAAPTGVPRPEVAARYRVPALTPAGFELSLSDDALGPAPEGRVAVVALMGERARLASAARQARWLTARSLRRDGDRLVASDGKVLTLDATTASGALTGARRLDDRVVLEGWAADVTGAGPVDRVVALVDGEHGQDAAPDAPRLALARALGLDDGAPLAFHLALPDEWFEAPVDGRVTVYALVGDRAIELPVGPDAAWVAAPRR